MVNDVREMKLVKFCLWMIRFYRIKDLFFVRERERVREGEFRRELIGILKNCSV